MQRGTNKKFCIDLISDSEIYKIFDACDISKLPKLGNNFIESTYRYYKKNGKLTEKQLPYVKDILSKKILQDKDDSFFYIKINKIKNIKRILDYIETLGLKFKYSDDGGLIAYIT